LKPLEIELWHDAVNLVGHLGDVHNDYNVQGHIHGPHCLVSAFWSLNGGAKHRLRTIVYRRIVRNGNFNIDIPINELRIGDNQIDIEAFDGYGNHAYASTIVRRVSSGEYPLPVHIRWKDVQNLSEVGQCTDGRWICSADGLRTGQVGYDRIFLIGNSLWRDYEAMCSVTINSIPKRNGPQSARVHHAGFCMRWHGHSLDKSEPDAQPKWGLHPRGGIVWVTKRHGHFQREFYPGNSEKYHAFGAIDIVLGKPFMLKGRCKTEIDWTDGSFFTTYSLKAWHATQPEPENWDFEVIETSKNALRNGGLALVAHETDVTFGDITVKPLIIEGVRDVSDSGAVNARSTPHSRVVMSEYESAALTEARSQTQLRRHKKKRVVGSNKHEAN